MRGLVWLVKIALRKGLALLRRRAPAQACAISPEEEQLTRQLADQIRGNEAAGLKEMFTGETKDRWP